MILIGKALRTSSVFFHIYDRAQIYIVRAFIIIIELNCKHFVHVILVNMLGRKRSEPVHIGNKSITLKFVKKKK